METGPQSCTGADSRKAYAAIEMSSSWPDTSSL